MTYVRMVGAALAAAPTWAWVAVVAMCAALVWYAERERTEHWRAKARKAANQARLWQAVAEARATGAFSGKRTRVAPQYHAPRAH